MPRLRPLPAVPPHGPKLVALLAAEAAAVLAAPGREAGLGHVMRAVMTSSVNTRVPTAASNRGLRIGDWITHHRDMLIDAVGMATDHEQIIRLATMLWLLAPVHSDRRWAVRLAEHAATATQTSHRPAEEAVLCELGARWNIAAGNLDDADNLHDRELLRLLLLRPRYGTRTIVALLWRRTRLAWARGRFDHALNHLSALTGTLNEHPDPFNQVLVQTARAEVLYAKGERTTAAAELAAADRYAAEHPLLVLERVDAQLTLGHALHAVDGPEAAQRQWARTHVLVTTAIHTSADLGLHYNTVNALERRRRHLVQLIDTQADGRPYRDDEFTILNPTTERFRPTPPIAIHPQGAPS